MRSEKCSHVRTPAFYTWDTPKPPGTRDDPFDQEALELSHWGEVSSHSIGKFLEDLGILVGKKSASCETVPEGVFRSNHLAVGRLRTRGRKGVGLVRLYWLLTCHRPPERFGQLSPSSFPVSHSPAGERPYARRAKRRRFRR